jgi:predicted porin
MKYQRLNLSIAMALVVSAAAFAPPAHAIDVQAGDWKLSITGNVNAHYIWSRCDTSPNPIAGGLACVDTDSSSSSVSNGLLPASLGISGATTQGGYDLGFTFGLYPGISTNDGGSPNLQQTGGTVHTALGTAGLDVRQVFLTFGNKDMGTVMAGRNIGLFGADAILNDMTLLGVGAGNGSYAAPANTSLGSIGLGYIYTDWLSQIDYTTPDLSGLKATIGIFDPLNTLSQVPASKKAPGIHAKVAWTFGSLYLSSSGLFQQQRRTTTTPVAGGGSVTVPGVNGDYNSWAVDFGGKYDIAGFEFAGWYYTGKGVGTTGLFVNSDDGFGDPRKSDGYLVQATYKIVSTKFGINYGQSNLRAADGDIGLGRADLVNKNDKVTLGIYQDLTTNLLLLMEFSRLESQNNLGQTNTSRNVNIGAFLKF